MAFVFTARYEPNVEERMRVFYQTLSEKDRRRYAAIEATQDERRFEGARFPCGSARARGCMAGVESLPVGSPPDQHLLG